MAPLRCCPVQRYFFLLLVFMQDRNLIAPLELSTAAGKLQWPCEHVMGGRDIPSHNSGRSFKSFRVFC